MANDINGSLRNVLPGNIDQWNRVYATVADANAAIPSTVVGGRNFREGKVVQIGTVTDHVEYRWQGGFGNNDLKPSLIQAFNKITDLVNDVPLSEVDITSTATYIDNSRMQAGNVIADTGFGLYKVSVLKGDRIDLLGYTASSNTSPSIPYDVSFQFNTSDVYTGQALGKTTVPSGILQRVKSIATVDGFIYINTRKGFSNKILKAVETPPFVYKKDIGKDVVSQDSFNTFKTTTEQSVTTINGKTTLLESNFGWSLLASPLSNFLVPVTTTYEPFQLDNFPRDQTIQGVLKANYIGRFSIYAHYETGFDIVYDSGTGKDFNTPFTFTFTLPTSKNYIYLRFRSWVSGVTIEYLNLNRYGVKSSSLPPVPESDVVSDLENAEVALYGDSITDINSNGANDYVAPIPAVDTKWGTIVAAYYKFKGLYSRGIGGQKFAWGNAGGSVAFVRANGTYHSRNDSFNYDNYTGSIPSGTVKVRGAFSSWIRITSMFPASIKDKITIILIKGATNDVVDSTEVQWLPASTVDPEWAASSQYATFGGDYNISTLKGGIASTIMKMQAWMPNAIIILATPLPGRATAGTLDPSLLNIETTKSIYVRDVAKLMSIPVIDVNANTGINGLNRTTYISDGVHPYTVAGNKMLARTVIGGLKTILPNI